MDVHAGLRLCYGHTTKSGFLVTMPKCYKDIVIEDIHELTIFSNNQKLSDNAKKSNVKRIKKILINQELVGFEPTCKGPIVLLAKTI